MIEKLTEHIQVLNEKSIESLNRNKNTIDELETLRFTANITKNLMMDLLDLAQCENNTFKINTETFNLLKVIEDAFLVVQHFAKKKKVSLVHHTIDPSSEALFKSIEGDSHRFQQILVNLLNNSLKFSTQGSEIRVNLVVLEKHATSLLRSGSFMPSMSNDGVCLLQNSRVS